MSLSVQWPNEVSDGQAKGIDIGNAELTSNCKGICGKKIILVTSVMAKKKNVFHTLQEGEPVGTSLEESVVESITILRACNA